MDTKVRRAMRKTSARLNRKLEQRMRELWTDKAFRKNLDAETAGVNKRNFAKYAKEAPKRSENELAG